MFLAKIVGTTNISNFFKKLHCVTVNAKKHLVFLQKYHSYDQFTIDNCEAVIAAFQECLSTEDITLEFSSEIHIEATLLADIVAFERDE